MSSVAPAVLGIRKFPFPFQAMLAVSSDADHETLSRFNLAHEFLNSTSMTPMGLGLDIVDSFSCTSRMGGSTGFTLTASSAV